LLHFFPQVYEDELLYSVLGRYHILSGNISFKQTLTDAFNTDTVIPVVDFPCSLNVLSQNICSGNKYNSQYFIDKCTLFPAYSPFMHLERKSELINIMKNDNGISLKYKIGYIAGGICKKSQLYYCPECAREELKTIGEAYFHRHHQFQGVFVCERHGCALKPYRAGVNESRVEYIRLLEENIDYKTNETFEDTRLFELMLYISREIKYLLYNNAKTMNADIIHNRYLTLLKDKGFLSVNGTIKWIDFQDEFINYYSGNLLEKFESNINIDSEYNWLKIIFRKPRRLTHPARHILLIKFLCKSIENFIHIKERTLNPFGKGPWPCLNPCCDNYKKLVVKECKVTADYKTREPVGAFADECGFIYSRKANDDINKAGTIKEFGQVWKDRLNELIHMRISIRSIARQMECDPKTVVKYADILGLKDMLNSNMKCSYNKENNKGIKVDRDKYRSDVMNMIKRDPNIKRQNIKESLYKQFIWLYKTDREWFEQNLPAPKRSVNIKHSKSLWIKKDAEVLKLLKSEYKKLLDSKELKRITMSLLGRRINKLPLLEKNIDKLPRTKKYLDEITESIEDYQCRRVDVICKRLYDEGRILKEWEIIRLCGLKTSMSDRVKERIN
jgi:hypothetical protein